MARRQINRRGFLGAAAAVLASSASGAAEGPAPRPATRPRLLVESAMARAAEIMGWGGYPSVQDYGPPVRLAVVGLGTQGGRLVADALVRLGGTDVRALCDLYPHRLAYFKRMLERYQHKPAVYEDFERMLEDRKDIDAVLIATPDWLHAEQTIACLQVGLHVYCEVPMAQTVQAAAQMVKAARKAGRLLQVGCQRRSTPRYRVAHSLVVEKRAIGRIVYASAHAHLPPPRTLVWAERGNFRPANQMIEKCGYETLDRLMNWRLYRKFSAGPAAEHLTTQVDFLNWMIGRPPKSLHGIGSREAETVSEWHDNATLLYEWDHRWEGKTFTVRGTWHLAAGSAFEGRQETIGGSEGGLRISTIGPPHEYIRLDETTALKDWEESLESLPIELGQSNKPINRYYRLTAKPQEERLPLWSHVENFVQAIRSQGRIPLNCPAEEAYKTAICTLSANDAANLRIPLKLGAMEYAL